MFSSKDRQGAATEVFLAEGRGKEKVMWTQWEHGSGPIGKWIQGKPTQRWGTGWAPQWEGRGSAADMLERSGSGHQDLSSTRLRLSSSWSSKRVICPRGFGSITLRKTGTSVWKADGRGNTLYHKDKLWHSPPRLYCGTHPSLIIQRLVKMCRPMESSPPH